MTHIEQLTMLNTIEEAVEDIKKGKVIIVVDDEDRESEGDFVAAAQLVSPELINFMAKHGRGLICTPLSESRCKELELELMVGKNTDPLDTAFTVSVDLRGNGVSTGISASDRAKTVFALTDPLTKPDDLRRHGHIFPLRAKEGGVLRRTGHTEAAIDFARLAGLQPAGVIVEIMNEDGTMARLPHLLEVAKKFNLKIVSIEDLIAYRMRHDSLIKKVEDFELKTNFGYFRLRAYLQTTNNQIHFALTKGNWTKTEHIMIRVNSSHSNHDVLGLLFNQSGQNLDKVFRLINQAEKGAIVFISKDLQSTDILGKLQELKNLQLTGNQISNALKMDDKDFGIGAQILHDLNIHKIKLISNSKEKKRVGMIGYGLEIVEYVGY